MRSRSISIESDGVGEPDAVAGGRPEHLGIGARGQHGGMHVHQRGIERSTVDVLRRAEASQSPMRAAETIIRATPSCTVTSRSGLARSARRCRPDVEPHAARHGALEAQRGIDLEEMIMAADLDGPVAGIRDGQRNVSRPALMLDGPGSVMNSPGVAAAAPRIG